MIFKKIGTIILTMIVILSMAVPAFADDGSTLVLENGPTLDVYQGGSATAIFKLHKNSDGKETITFSGSSNNPDIKSTAISINGTTLNSNSVALNGKGDYKIYVTVTAASFVPVDIYSYSINAKFTTQNFTKSCSVDVNVKENSSLPASDDISLESYSSSSIYPGQTFTVNMFFLASGTDTNPATISLSSSGFKMVDGGSNITNKSFSFADNRASVSVTLVAPSDIMGGTSSVDFKVNYSGRTSDISVPIYIIRYNDESEPDDKVISTTTPHLVITGYKLGGETIIPGEDIRLTISFMNTSKYHKVENVIMSYSLPSGTALKNASTNFYFDSIPAGGTASQAITIASDKTLAEGIQNFSISFAYEYKDNDIYTAGSDSESFGLMVSATGKKESSDRFEISNIEVPDEIYLGNEDYITINVINKGSAALNNVSAKINSEKIKNDGDNEYFGMLNANTKSEIELPIDPSEEGTIIGTITISYEHADGETVEVTKDFSVYCVDPNAWQGEDPGWDEPYYEEPIQQGLPTWAIVCIVVGGVAVAATATVLIVKAVKKKKAAEALDDEDI